jgi:hypothetical protein
MEDLILTVEVDARGNFYTTETINFENGLNVEAENPDGNISQMTGPITTGACNSCHDGVGRDRIIAFQ